MSEAERERYRMVRRALGAGVKIYELVIVVVSEGEWAASAALVGGGDRRFRFTRGRLHDEACIGDARV